MTRLLYANMPLFYNKGGDILNSILNLNPDALYDPSIANSAYVEIDGGTAAGNTDSVGLLLDMSQIGRDYTSFVAGQTEEVTNGDGSSATGWLDARSDHTITSTGGRIRATSVDGTTGGVSQALTGFTVGRYYVISCDLFGTSGSGDARVRFQNNQGLTSGSGELGSGAGDFSVTNKIFVANATTMYIGAIQVSPSIGEFIELDNISVKELPGHHMEAPSDAARPVLTVSGGLSYLTSDGTNDYLTAENGINWTGAEMYGAVGMRALSVQDSDERYVSLGNTSGFQDDNASARAALIIRNGTNEQVRALRNSTTGAVTALSDDADAVVESGYNGSTHYINASGGADTTVSVANTDFSITRLRIFSSADSTPAANEYSDARIYGLVMFNSLPTASQRSLIRSYLNSRSGI